MLACRLWRIVHRTALPGAWLPSPIKTHTRTRPLHVDVRQGTPTCVRRVRLTMAVVWITCAGPLVQQQPPLPPHPSKARVRAESTSLKRVDTYCSTGPGATVSLRTKNKREDAKQLGQHAMALISYTKPARCIQTEQRNVTHAVALG